jgi:hypothetical protein
MKSTCCDGLPLSCHHVNERLQHLAFEARPVFPLVECPLCQLIRALCNQYSFAMEQRRVPFPAMEYFRRVVLVVPVRKTCDLLAEQIIRPRLLLPRAETSAEDSCAPALDNLLRLPYNESAMQRGIFPFAKGSLEHLTPFTKCCAEAQFHPLLRGLFSVLL